MTIQTVPTDPLGLATYVQTTTFEGSEYVLEFDYNQRCAAWYLSIADASNVDIVNGTKLTCGIPLLRKCKDPRRPPGQLLVVSSSPADQTPPGLLDLLPGTGRCQLLYITSDWVALMAAGQFDTIIAQLASNVQTSALSTYGEQ